MTTYFFNTTGDAYDTVQCSDKIKNGDTLVVVKEKYYGQRVYNRDGEFDRYEFDPPKTIGPVVGLAWAWPVAVTKESGHLHSLDDKAGALESVMADAKWTEDQVIAACGRAALLGAELAAPFKAYVDEQMARLQELADENEWES